MRSYYLAKGDCISNLLGQTMMENNKRKGMEEKKEHHSTKQAIFFFPFRFRGAPAAYEVPGKRWN